MHAILWLFVVTVYKAVHRCVDVLNPLLFEHIKVRLIWMRHCWVVIALELNLSLGECQSSALTQNDSHLSLRCKSNKQHALWYTQKDADKTTSQSIQRVILYTPLLQNHFATLCFSFLLVWNMMSVWWNIMSVLCKCNNNVVGWFWFSFTLSPSF